MRQTIFALALPLTLLIACSSGPGPSGPAGRTGAPSEATPAGGGAEAPPEPVDHPAPASDEASHLLDLALDRALDRGLDRELDRKLDRELDPEADGQSAWADFHVLSECTEDGGFRQVEVWGDGVAIYNETRQYRLGADQVRSILRALDEAQFPAMEDLYGGEADRPEGDGRESGEAAVMRVTCRVVVTLGGVTKQSAQLDEGEQSEELDDLAETILDIGRDARSAVVTAANLDDGLAKVADGRMAPQALTLVFHRKPDAFAQRRGEPAYILRLDGRWASVSPFDPDRGYGEPVVRALSDEELGEVASLLATERTGELPGNLYAVHYTDLVVDVLDQDQRIQARQFARMTRSTHGEAQERFDRIVDGLAEVALGLLKPGT